MQILWATTNIHKASELTQLSVGIFDNVQFLTLRDLEHPPSAPEETGVDLAENAKLKAEYYFHATGIACLADDTGLEVQALGGEPGVKSARYAGDQASDADNREKLHKELALRGSDSPPANSARFRTVLCLADNKRTALCEGVCNGEIIKNEHGDRGFGYDAMFIPTGYTETFAEMSSKMKNSISHRGIAMRLMLEILREHYGNV